MVNDKAMAKEIQRGKFQETGLMYANAASHAPVGIRKKLIQYVIKKTRLKN